MSRLPLALLVAAGCGPAGPRLYDVSGTVTFAGRPVPAGRVVFTPDAGRGHDGPVGFAEVRGGRYDTAADGGLGTVGGPHTVRVTGSDGRAVSDDGGGRPLFPDYETAADLPRGRHALDIDVPDRRAAP